MTVGDFGVPKYIPFVIAALSVVPGRQRGGGMIPDMPQSDTFVV
jgi:hypothetical protein